ncbi:polysaccharide deacetylase family protein [bacterium]|nr:polysaccharide deacetylase family protein [bacterium]
MSIGAYRTWLARLLLLVVLAVLPLLLSAYRLNLSYLTPDGHIAVDQDLLIDMPLKVCALTFDDGPDAKYTAQVMEILDSYGVKGTFFLLGERVQRYPDQVKALVRSGHEIGNHTHQHRDLTKLAVASQQSQIKQADEILDLLGVECRWFRPPYGEFTQDSLDYALSLDMETILWSVDPKDWAQPGAETIKARVLKQTGPGAVILLHSTNAQTVAALPGIIEGLHERGYTFATLTQWRALVTGQAPPPEQGLLQYLPQVGGALAVPHQPTGEVFYQPYSESQPVPRIIEQLENRTPADRGHVLWSWVRANAHSAALTGGDGRVALRTEPPAASPATAPAAAEPDTLVVYTNFGTAQELNRVFRQGGQNRLHLVEPRRAAPYSEPIQQIETMQAAPEAIAIEDTPVEPAPELPVLPEGEELILPPGRAEPLLPVESAPAEPADNANAQSWLEVVPAEETPPALPVAEPPAPARDLPRMSFRVVDLVDMDNPETLWTPPASLDAEQFQPFQPPVATTGPLPEPRYYFLAMVGDLEHYTWNELHTYVRLARLSGLVLPGDVYYAPPPPELPYPWTYASQSGTDRSAWIDLTVEDIADVMEVVKRGKQQIFIVVRPANLHFFIAAHTWAEMNTNMRDFVLFRQMTGGMACEAQPAIAGDWQLPEGVELARFSDGPRESLVLYSQSYRPVNVTVPPSCRHMSRAYIDAGGYLKIAGLQDKTVTVDRSPVILYYEAQPAG